MSTILRGGVYLTLIAIPQPFDDATDGAAAGQVVGFGHPPIRNSIQRVIDRVGVCITRLPRVSLRYSRDTHINDTY